MKCWRCGRIGHFRRNCISNATSPRNGQLPGRQRQTPRPKVLSCENKITAVPQTVPLRVMLELRVEKIPAPVDTGTQFSCVRSDVTEFLYLAEEPCSFLSSSVVCLLSDGRRCEINNAVKLHVKLLSLSWDHEFKILQEGAFPAILGLDFLTHTRMRVDVASREFSFGFTPGCSGTFLK